LDDAADHHRGAGQGCGISPRYAFRLLDRLRYPRALISLAYLESDSLDGTFEALGARLEQPGRRYRRRRLLQQNMGFHLPPGTPRWAPQVQLPRRAALSSIAQSSPVSGAQRRGLDALARRRCGRRSALMAFDMGYLCWGMPDEEVIHALG
jgi:hypothetical protein